MRILQKLRRLSRHLSMILALCFLTFAILDWYNPMMGFITNAVSSKLLIVFCVTALISSLSDLAAPRQKTESVEERREARRARRERRE